MSYAEAIDHATQDAATLESLYQHSLKAHEEGAFGAAIEERYAQTPDNLLYAAWHYRLTTVAATVRRRIAWIVALPLALACGAILFLLSDFDGLVIQPTHPDGSSGFELPVFFLWWAPIVALFVLAFLDIAGKRRRLPAVLVGAGLALLAVYPFGTYTQLAETQRQEHYLVLMIFILPLLAWAAVGVLLLLSARDAENRFAYLIKSIEIIIVGGLCGIAVGFFTVIAFALFGTLGIMPPMLVQRLFMIGLSGAVPVLVVAILYDPTTAPGAQSFDEGLSKLVALLLRMLLPLTILVLLFYVAFIPFRFWEPFQNRDVLIAYNAMLFAVLFLLVGATPIHLDELSVGQQRWLRRGLLTVAALAAVVSAYAFAAITYRTAQDGFTPNRLSFIGWNLINGCILLVFLFRQLRKSGEDWLSPIKRTYSQGSIAYIGWALFLILALPWLF